MSLSQSESDWLWMQVRFGGGRFRQIRVAGKSDAPRGCRQIGVAGK